MGNQFIDQTWWSTFFPCSFETLDKDNVSLDGCYIDIDYLIIVDYHIRTHALRYYENSLDMQHFISCLWEISKIKYFACFFDKPSRLDIFWQCSKYMACYHKVSKCVYIIIKVVLCIAYVSIYLFNTFWNFFS